VEEQDKYILALDVGTQRIGLAKGRLLTRLAAPLQTIRRRSVRKDSQQLAAICQQQKIAVILVGLPLQLDGQEGRSARLARQVGDALHELTGLPVQYHDERFSSVEAERRLREVGKSFHKRKKQIDEIAAAVILEDWFQNQG